MVTERDPQYPNRPEPPSLSGRPRRSGFEALEDLAVHPTLPPSSMEKSAGNSLSSGRNVSVSTLTEYRRCVARINGLSFTHSVPFMLPRPSIREHRQRPRVSSRPCRRMRAQQRELLWMPSTWSALQQSLRNGSEFDRVRPSSEDVNPGRTGSRLTRPGLPGPGATGPPEAPEGVTHLISGNAVQSKPMEGSSCGMRPSSAGS